MDSVTIRNLELLKTIQVCQDHPELEPELLKAILEVSKSSAIVELKDCSIGHDQTVFSIKTDSSFEAIIKIPLSSYREKDDSDFFPMHLPNKQAWLLKALEQQKQILCPHLLYLDPKNKFFIETFVPEANLKEVMDQVSENEMKHILNDLGTTMKGLHQVKSMKFGYISFDDNNHGKFDNWLDMFNEYHKSLEECTEVVDMDEAIVQKIKEIYNEQRDYLASFNEPCLLHADLSFNNIRVRRENEKWRLSAVIDFADVLSGDPLLDFGQFLGDRCGDWKVIDLMEETYLDGAKFTTSQRKLIRFYAIYYCLWWLAGSIGLEKTQCVDTLYHLVNMKFD